MGFWGALGRGLLKYGGIAAAPFTGGMSLAATTAINAGLGAASGAASGKGWKGALMGAGMGAATGGLANKIPGVNKIPGGIMNLTGGSGGTGGQGSRSIWPAVLTAGAGAGIAALGNRKTGAEKGMEGMLSQYQGLSNQIGSFAQKQHTMAEPALSKALGYYTQLASGNRAQIGQAIAPDMAAAGEVYKGAERGLEARTAPGPTRDRQMGEMARQKAGQMALMPMQARSGAYGNLATMGQNLNNNILGAYNAMGSNLGNMGNVYSQMANMQQQRNQGWAQLGSNMANIFLPYILNRKGGAGKSTQPPGVSGGIIGNTPIYG